MPHFSGMPQAAADAYRAGELDANSHPPERAVSDGTAPCRCCLKLIDAGSEMLLLAYRPFGAPQPYAEMGPVFLCADACDAVAASPDRPDFMVSHDYLVKGYSADERIVYGTGQITPTDEISSYAETLLAREDIAFVDVRSAKNNCWLVRLAQD